MWLAATEAACANPIPLVPSRRIELSMAELTTAFESSSELPAKRAMVPLLLAYVAFPLSNLLAESLGVQLWRNWIDVAWILLAVLSMSFGRRYASRLNHKVAPIGLIVLVLVGMTWVFAGVVRGAAPAITAALEVKPLAYLAVVVILVRSGAIPTPQQFCRVGVVLSTLLVAETALRSVLAGTLERPSGSGEVNYDAALILLSLVFSLARRDFASRYGPMLLVGLLASFSRTSLVAACLVLLLARTVPVPVKGVAMCAALTAVVLSFLIRGLELGALEGMDRYWMWVVGIEHFAPQWPGLAINFSPGSVIDVDVPRFLADLWLGQQEKLDVEGIFPFHFHALWVRLPAAWGWAPTLVLLLLFLHMTLMSRGMPLESRSYACTCLMLGMTMGLFYLSIVGVPYLLAWAQLRARWVALRRQCNAKTSVRARPLPAPCGASVGSVTIAMPPQASSIGRRPPTNRC